MAFKKIVVASFELFAAIFRLMDVFLILSRVYLYKHSYQEGGGDANKVLLL